MSLVAVLLVLLATKADKPDLVLRATPRMGNVTLAIGCMPVTLVAEITGPETPELYCPRVEWEWPDGTHAVTESDCPPFEDRNSCLEPQTGCGALGFHLNARGEQVDDRKDCPCTIIGYQRLFRPPSGGICLPAADGGSTWEIGVRLVKQGRVLRSATTTVIVH